jgi:hypothetical protein
MEMSSVKLIFSFGKPVVRNEPVKAIVASKIITFQNQPIRELPEMPTYFILDAERAIMGVLKKANSQSI